MQKCEVFGSKLKFATETQRKLDWTPPEERKKWTHPEVMKILSSSCLQETGGCVCNPSYKVLLERESLG